LLCHLLFARAGFRRLEVIEQREAGGHLAIILESKRKAIYYAVTAREAKKKEQGDIVTGKGSDR